MSQPLESLLAGTQPDLARLRMAFEQALESGLNRQDAGQLVLAHAIAYLGRALCLANRAEAGIELLAEFIEFQPSAGSHAFLDLLIRQAEQSGVQCDWQDAINRWQDVAVLMGADTPDFVYREISHAYSENRQGFGGSPEENDCWGDCHKHDVLAFLHQILQPSLYLEIGVDEGLSLARALGPAIGIDPRPFLSLKAQLPESARVLPLSSDAFFSDEAKQLLPTPPELIFIDGMHLFEFVLRDFISVERHACPHSLVVIDDIYPCHPVQASRRRRSDAWTGDVWKFHRILERERPDLTLLALNAHTTGLLLIAGLNPEDMTLQASYPKLIREFRPVQNLPEAVLDRIGAIPSSSTVLADLLRCLKKAKAKKWSVAEVQVSLKPVRETAIRMALEYQWKASGANDGCNLARLADGLQN